LYETESGNILQIIKGRCGQGEPKSGNPVYCKSDNDATGLCGENTHEPIIDEELFYRVQEQLKPRTASVDNFKHENLFSRVLFCGDCGKKKISTITKKNKIRYNHARSPEGVTPFNWTSFAFYKKLTTYIISRICLTEMKYIFVMTSRGYL